MFFYKNKINSKTQNAFCSLAFTFLLAFTLASCGQNFFPEFKVENSCLENGKAVVNFSAPVRVQSIKENFYFTQDGNNVDGEFSFAGSRVAFTPVNTIEENHCYEILIYTGAEDIDGNSLEKEYKRQFYTKDDLSRPQVLHIENILNAEGKTNALKIQFNKKMNEQSFVENFSIEPSAAFITKWNNAGDTVELLFEKELTEKTFYAVKIDTAAKDALNNLFAKEFRWSFQNVPDYITPEFTVHVFNCNTESYELISGTAENVDFSKEIEIKFSKNFDADKFAQSICVEPKISYEIVPALSGGSNFSDNVKIKFTETPKWNTNYRLIVYKNIADNYGTCVEEKNFVLKNNSEKLRPPTFEALVIKVGDEFKTISKNNNFTDISFDPEIYQPGFENNVPLYFIFRISDSSKTINEESARSSITISPQNSCVKLTPIKTNICSYNQITESELRTAIDNAVSAFGLQDANLVCVQFNTSFYNGESGKSTTCGIIDFKIAKTLCDNNKNFMEEAVQVSCNKM